MISRSRRSDVLLRLLHVVLRYSLLLCVLCCRLERHLHLPRVRHLLRRVLHRILLLLLLLLPGKLGRNRRHVCTSAERMMESRETGRDRRHFSCHVSCGQHRADQRGIAWRLGHNIVRRQVASMKTHLAVGPAQAAAAWAAAVGPQSWVGADPAKVTPPTLTRQVKGRRSTDIKRCTVDTSRFAVQSAARHVAADTVHN